MTTLVTGPLRRSVSADTFASIAPGVDFKPSDDGLLFDADLTPTQVAAIASRMASRDDADQAARANLADLLANDTTASPLAKAVADYLLGGAP